MNCLGMAQSAYISTKFYHTQNISKSDYKRKRLWLCTEQTCNLVDTANRVIFSNEYIAFEKIFDKGIQKNMGFFRKPC